MLSREPGQKFVARSRQPDSASCRFCREFTHSANTRMARRCPENRHLLIYVNAALFHTAPA